MAKCGQFRIIRTINPRVLIGIGLKKDDISRYYILIYPFEGRSRSAIRPSTLVPEAEVRFAAWGLNFFRMKKGMKK